MWYNSPTNTEDIMTVAKLIAKLQALPGDKRVVIVDRDGRASEIYDAYEGFTRQDFDLFLQGSPTVTEIEEIEENEENLDYVVGVISE